MKKNNLMNAFFNSQFSYCPLVWMYHSRALNNKINRLHERCLRLIYNDKQLTFEELLEKDDSASIHIRNLQTIAIEMCKVMNGGYPEITKEIFRIREESEYNLRHQNTFRSSSAEVFLGKRCSENMQQIHRRTLIPKCGFNKVALHLG